MKAALSAGIVAAMACGATALAGPEIVREGTGERRAALDQMELQPFQAGLWEHLTSWTGGDRLDAQATKGKVVLLVSWASWYPSSVRSLRVAQSLAERFADDLIVVGVHHPDGWETAAEAAKSAGVSFRTAHDAEGAFREALLIDQDPDFYVIDRAGNLRFADIVTTDVEAAVTQLVRESEQSAATLPERLAAREAEQQRLASQSRTLSSAYVSALTEEVPFQLPDRSAYDHDRWPEHNKKRLTAQNVQGKGLPVAFSPDRVQWLTDRPKLEGRVVVLDFWATWCQPCRRAIPGLEALARKHKDDLVIIGVGGQDEPISAVQGYLRAHRSPYAHVFDEQQNVYKGLRINAIPHVVVLSTDGVVRWQGNPLEPEFRSAVDKTIEVDPGVAARRMAKAAYLDQLRRQDG